MSVVSEGYMMLVLTGTGKLMHNDIVCRIGINIGQFGTGDKSSVDHGFYYTRHLRENIIQDKQTYVKMHIGNCKYMYAKIRPMGNICHVDESFSLTDRVQILGFLVGRHKFVDGTYHFANGFLHRDGRPAVELSSGTNKWYNLSRLHRIGAPAIEFMNGTKEWYRDGVLHRLDGPAIESSERQYYWYREGVLHRDDGGPAVSTLQYRRWYNKGVLLVHEDIVGTNTLTPTITDSILNMLN